MSDADDLRELTAEALRRTGTDDLMDMARSAAFAGLEPDLEALLRLRLGLDRSPPRGRTRAEVGEAMGIGGPSVDRMVEALEEDALLALGPPPAIWRA
jgi:hypothetical protein